MRTDDDGEHCTQTEEDGSLTAASPGRGATSPAAPDKPHPLKMCSDASSAANFLF